jgi:phospholipid transport system transporter-binding protein
LILSHSPLPSDLWQLTGELTFTTVSHLLTAFLNNPQRPQQLDLQAVSRVDSAGLAFLIEIRRQQPNISLLNLPPQLLKLAEINHVVRLLTEVGQV